MDTQRTLLFVALSLIMWMIWQTWELEHSPQLSKQTTQESKNFDDTSSQNEPARTNSSGVPAIKNRSESGGVPSPTEDNGRQSFLVAQKNHNYKADIKVKTDVFDVWIDETGGTIVKLALLKYPVDVEHKNQAFSLLQTSGEDKPFYILESGIKGVFGADKNLFPAHDKAIFKAEQTQFVLQDDTLLVPMFWQNNGIKVTKTYIFTRGSYLVKVAYKITNDSKKIWKGGVYGQLNREGLLENEEPGFTNYSYTGGAHYNKKDGYKKVSFSDLSEKTLEIKKAEESWVGFIQHYFTGAIIPTNKNAQIYSYKSQNNFVVGALMPVISVLPNEAKTVDFDLFLGPKLQDKMKQARPGLELTVDYGWLTVVSEPIFWLLKFIYGFVANWGLAIILVTLFIKLVFFKLSATSYKSMARMRNLHPRMVAMRERYADDKQKLNQAMMKLYKEEKVNPMGGCLPILVQMPVFIALYWVLLESVELRQASFLWLSDLSIKDPFFILPLLMGVSMFLQQKLNPKPADPMQAKVMSFLPIIFTIFFAFFPSGLVLYWTANNILSILQQWAITKKYGSTDGNVFSN